MCGYVYVYICICVYICMYIYIYVHTINIILFSYLNSIHTVESTYYINCIIGFQRLKFGFASAIFLMFSAIVYNTDDVCLFFLVEIYKVLI